MSQNVERKCFDLFDLCHLEHCVRSKYKACFNIRSKKLFDIVLCHWKCLIKSISCRNVTQSRVHIIEVDSSKIRLTTSRSLINGCGMFLSRLFSFLFSWGMTYINAVVPNAFSTTYFPLYLSIFTNSSSTKTFPFLFWIQTKMKMFYFFDKRSVVLKRLMLDTNNHFFLFFSPMVVKKKLLRIRENHEMNLNSLFPRSVCCNGLGIISKSTWNLSNIFFSIRKKWKSSVLFDTLEVTSILLPAYNTSHTDFKKNLFPPISLMSKLCVLKWM